LRQSLVAAFIAINDDSSHSHELKGLLGQDGFASAHVSQFEGVRALIADSGVDLSPVGSR
jgi:hypothetical protein